MHLFYLANNGENRGIVEKIQAKLAEYIEENPDKELIRGTGWDYVDFPKGPPTKGILDAVCTEKPIFLESYCQHHMWLNSKALEVANITKDTPEPRAGKIERDKNGNPTGILSEFTAINLVKGHVKGYDTTVEQYKESLLAYQNEYAHPYGVTMIFDALSSENAKIAYQELAKEGKLSIRVHDNIYADPAKPMSQFDEIIAQKGRHDVEDMYVVNTVKFFMESAPPDAYLTKPYKPLACLLMKRPIGYKGYPFWTAEELQEAFTKLMDAGWQVHIHAMGDGSVKHTIDGLEYAQRKTGKNTRSVIAHLMYVQPEDFGRMAQNGIIACLQPAWSAMAKSEFDTAVLGMGRKRAEQFQPYRRFLDKGVIVSAGTDFPVMPPPDPFIDMQHAITRKPCRRAAFYEASKDFCLAPKKNIVQDMVQLKDVIQARTIGGAYQNFAEAYTGSIEIGKSAEFAILDRKLFDTPVEDICDTKVVKTIFKGKVVYDSEQKY